MGTFGHREILENGILEERVQTERDKWLAREREKAAIAKPSARCCDSKELMF